MIWGYPHGLETSICWQANSHQLSVTLHLSTIYLQFVCTISVLWGPFSSSFCSSPSCPSFWTSSCQKTRKRTRRKCFVFGPRSIGTIHASMYVYMYIYIHTYIHFIYIYTQIIHNIYIHTQTCLSILGRCLEDQYGNHTHMFFLDHEFPTPWPTRAGPKRAPLLLLLLGRAWPVRNDRVMR